MATPAQFSIILYSEKEFVGADGQPVEKTFNFQLPSDAVLSPAILQFMVHTTANVDELAADISINGKRVYHYGTSSEYLTRMFQVVLSGTRDFPLKRGANVLKVRKTNGNGAFGLSNFVVWFRQPTSSVAGVLRRKVASKTRKTARPSARKRKTKGR